MSALIQLAYRAQRRIWTLLRPRTRGVKILLVTETGQVLLVRNSYGATDLWVLPGGGVRPWEAPGAAARREVHEELGCSIRGLRPVSTHFTAAEGKRDTVFLFEAEPVGVPRADCVELLDARFFALDKLPDKLSPATARRMAERRGERIIDGGW